VRPHLFAGLGINVSTHRNIRPATACSSTFDQSAYAAYNDLHGFRDERQTSGGTSAGCCSTPATTASTRSAAGWRAPRPHLLQRVPRRRLDWQQMTLDVRTYRRLTRDGRQRLAFWFISDNVLSGTAPYLDLPATGSDGRSARGYSDGRYRGEHLAYGEMEYRGTITRNGLLGSSRSSTRRRVDNADARTEAVR
jgi:hypothetical protein